MEEQIKNIVLKLSVLFYSIWVNSVIIFLASELNWFPVGFFADDAVVDYLLQVIGIFITVLGVPGSLKLFNWQLSRKIDLQNPEKALETYSKISILRMCVLEFVVIFNWIVYCFTLNNNGMLCAMIGLVATLFCVPSANRVLNDLKLEDK